MIYAVVAAVIVVSAIIWAILPNPGFVPGIAHRGRTPHPYFTSGVMTFAHRGGDREMPGERLATFRRAASLGVDAFEIDVRLSSDGVPMVFHDESVDRTTNGTGRVRDLSCADLQGLDGGWWWPHQDKADRQVLPDEEFPWRRKGMRVLTLQELFEAFPGMRMNIDCKDHDDRAVGALCALVDLYDRFDRTLVASFSHRTVRDCRDLLPEAATAASPREAAFLLALSFFGLGRLSKPSYQALQVPPRWGRLRIITPRAIASAHRQGIHVTAWTIDERPEMERLLAMGIDGVVSDRPSVLLEVVRRRYGGIVTGGEVKP